MTASSVPVLVATSKPSPWSCQPRKKGTRIRCPEELTGRNSVIPCTMERTTAWTGVTARTSLRASGNPPVDRLWIGHRGHGCRFYIYFPGRAAPGGGPNSMDTILVTGGAGFIGCNFVRLALAATEARVLVLDKLTYAGSLENLAGVLDDPRFEFVQGDIADRAVVRRLFAEKRPAA